jgi:putative ABC transport system permease protein
MINLLRTLTIGYVRQHQMRTALIVLTIALGVSAMVATQALGRSLKSGVQKGVNPLAGLADLLVVKGQAGVPADMARRIREMKIEGLKDARPFVFSRVALADLNNEPCWVFGAELPKEGLSASNDLGVSVKSTYQRPRGLLEAAQHVKHFGNGELAVVTPGIVEGLGKLPESAHGIVSIRNAGRTRTYLVWGTVDFSKSQLPVKNSHVVILELQKASLLCFPEKPGQVHQINVTLEEGADLEAVKEELQEMLGDEANVQTLDASRALVSDVTAGLEIGLAIGGVGALIVGLFLVYNALSVCVAERRHDIGILRSIGATRTQVAGLFLGESLIMGVIGSLIGLPLGWLMAWLALTPMARVITDLLVPVDNVTVDLPVWLMVVSVVCGTLVAGVAAIVPALQASQEEPADAVRRVPKLDDGVLIALQLAAVLLLVVVGGAMVYWRASLPRYVGMFAGIVALLLGGLVATPLLARVVGRLVQPFFRYFLGLEGRLAADNLVLSPGRTGLVIAAIAATGALLVQTAGFLKSSKEAITDWIEEKIAADLFVTCGSSVTQAGAALTMRDSMTQELAALPGVDVVVPVRFQQLLWTNPRDAEQKIIWAVGLDVAAFDGKEGHALGRSLARLHELRQPGTVAISQNFASLYGIREGDTIQLPVRGADVEVRVIGTFTDYTWNRGTVMMDRRWMKGLYEDNQVDIFDVFLKPGADRAAVEKAIATRYGASEAVFTQDRQQIYDGVQATLTKIYSMAYAQQLVVGVVALLGVVSALYISVLQRKRDLGLLRAVGATRTQVLRSVLAEAILMGIVGAAVGFFIGLVLEWYALNIMIYDESGFLFPMRVPWLEAGAVSLGSVALATVAGLWPAYLATTLRIPDAIAYE